jgi:hypothetical protein
VAVDHGVQRPGDLGVTRQAPTPLGRIAGAAGSWLLFAFSFTGLLLASSTLISLGGYCATGGPYVIATGCPGIVLLFFPVGLIGSLVAVGVSVAFAHDFATPLFAWAWPVFFGGLGVVFLVGALSGVGIVSNLLVAVVSLALGLGPLALGLRGGGLRTFLVGSRTMHGEPFDRPDPRSRLLRPRSSGDATPVPLTPARAAIAIGIPAVAAALGCLLAVAAVGAAV